MTGRQGADIVRRVEQNTVAQQEAGSAEQQIMAALDRKLKRIEALMPSGVVVDPKRMAATVMVEIQRNPKLAMCDPDTIIGCVVRVSQLGLEFGPDLGQAYMIPRRNNRTGKMEASLQLGYTATVALVLRSPDVSRIIARAVREKDEFDYGFGTEEFLRHKPAEGLGSDDEKGKVVYAYALVWSTKGGPPLFHVIDRAEIERRRQRGDNGPAWKTDYAAMAAKSAIQAMKRFLPLTTQVALAADDAVITMSDRGDGVLAVERPEPVGAIEPPTGEITRRPEPPPQDDAAADPEPEHAGSPIGATAGATVHKDLARAKVPTELHAAVIAQASRGRTVHAAALNPSEAALAVGAVAADCAADPSLFAARVLGGWKPEHEPEARAALAAWLEAQA